MTTYQISVPVTQIVYGCVYATVEAESIEEAMMLARNHWSNSDRIEVSCDGRIEFDGMDEDAFFNDPDNYDNCTDEDTNEDN
jgi:hypothetical protein